MLLKDAMREDDESFKSDLRIEKLTARIVEKLRSKARMSENRGVQGMKEKVKAETSDSRPRRLPFAVADKDRAEDGRLEVAGKPGEEEADHEIYSGEAGAEGACVCVCMCRRGDDAQAKAIGRTTVPGTLENKHEVWETAISAWRRSTGAEIFISTHSPPRHAYTDRDGSTLAMSRCAHAATARHCLPCSAMCADRRAARASALAWHQRGARRHAAAPATLHA